MILCLPHFWNLPQEPGSSVPHLFQTLWGLHNLILGAFLPKHYWCIQTEIHWRAISSWNLVRDRNELIHLYILLWMLVCIRNIYGTHFFKQPDPPFELGKFALLTSFVWFLHDLDHLQTLYSQYSDIGSPLFNVKKAEKMIFGSVRTPPT